MKKIILAVGLLILAVATDSLGDTNAVLKEDGTYILNENGSHILLESNNTIYQTIILRKGHKKFPITISITPYDMLLEDGGAMLYEDGSKMQLEK